jgi:hypothetical protein
MADIVAFHAALVRCGFNADTAEEITNQGFDLAVLPTIEEADVDAMIKNVRETRRALGAEAEGEVNFPFLPIKRFKAMRFWAAELVRTGRALVAGSFTGPEIANAIIRRDLEKLREDNRDDDTPKKPKMLDDLSKWETFWEEWKTFTGRIRGAAKCPITWIFRAHEMVTQAHYNAAYGDHDSRLIATTVFQGPWFELDNARVYDEFKSLVLKGPGWSFVKQYDRTKNGRAAVLALRRQCEGISAVQTRKAMAYAKIAAARYSGQKRNFTFDNYVEQHQDGHNTLADLEEPVPETKKVTDFLSGITDPRLNNSKDVILGDVAKLQDFEACQQYLKTLIFNKSTQDKHERHIASVHSPHEGGRQRGGKRKGGKQKTTEGLTKNYTKEEWFKLSAEQRERIKEARSNAKKQRKEQGGEQLRQAAALTTASGLVTPAAAPLLTAATGINHDFIRQCASMVSDHLTAQLAQDSVKKGVHWGEPEP